MPDDVDAILTRTGAYLQGHFLLSSGRHSSAYLQMALPFEHPADGQVLACALAEQVRLHGLVPQTVVGPALGAIVPGYALASALGCRFLFTERGSDGRMALRRGFSVTEGERLLVCENTVTTGGSVREVLEVLRAAGGNVIGVAVFGDRSPDPTTVFDVPYVALKRVEFASWEQDNCPLCQAGVPVISPGSRHLR